MTTPKPKTVTAWVVFDDEGKLLIWSVEANEAASIRDVENKYCTNWHDLKEQGYTVHEIRIEVVK